MTQPNNVRQLHTEQQPELEPSLRDILDAVNAGNHRDRSRHREVRRLRNRMRLVERKQLHTDATVMQLAEELRELRVQVNMAVHSR
jgi:hypothetical protein